VNRFALVMISMASLTCASALAQTVSGNGTSAPAAQSIRPFDVTASTPEWCSVLNAGGQGATTGLNNNTVGPIGSELQIIDLVDPTTLSTRAASATIGFEVACNYPHQVTVRSLNNGLRRITGASGPGIASGVPYTATLNWGDTGLSFFADAQSPVELRRQVNTSSAVAGPLTIAVAISAGATNIGPNSPLGAGEYSDVISIEVGPL
jgi:hypothetical protein